MEKVPNSQRLDLMIGVCLAVVTLALFSPAAGYQFNNYDDAEYVVDNVHVKTGLTLVNIAWAFTSGYACNWHPLTWISHMIDCEVFGLRSGWHHVTNVIIHAANSVLLYAVLRRMTGFAWRSAFVAALFAWHPVHVESVAFVAERKDVLSAFFGFATLWFYAGYARDPTSRRFAYVVVAFALGLLSKPMLVTLPLLMLLLDYWPLDRVKSFSGILLEKVPLFLLCGVSSALTMWAQKKGGAVAPITSLPIDVRCVNAINAYANYLGKIFLPINLSAFYPYHYHVSWIRTLSALLLVLGLTMIAFGATRRRPWFPVGWFWFVIALLPVIGLVQVGNQSMADRYTYIPAIGIFLVVTWEVSSFVALHRSRAMEPVCACVAGVILVACIVTTSRQLPYWRDSRAIFTHALEVTPNNPFAEICLGVELLNENRVDEAIGHFESALQMDPHSGKAAANLGLAYLDEGKISAGESNLALSVQFDPDDPYAEYGLARALDAEGKLDEAIPHYQAAVRINPDLPEAQSSLGALLVSQGKPAEAESHFATALLAKPSMWDAHFQYGNALLIEKKLPEAEAHYREAVRLNPNSAYPELNLAVALERQGKVEEGAIAAEAAYLLATNSGDTNLAAQLRTHLDSWRSPKAGKKE